MSSYLTVAWQASHCLWQGLTTVSCRYRTRLVGDKNGLRMTSPPMKTSNSKMGVTERVLAQQSCDSLFLSIYRLIFVRDLAQWSAGDIARAAL